jgi:aspartyl protease family protein
MSNNIATFVVIGVVAMVGASYLDSKVNGLEEAETAVAEPVAGRRSPGVAYISANRVGQFDLSALINGQHVRLMADTGATLVALTNLDARKVGIDVSKLVFDTPVMTANGRAMKALTRLDSVVVGGIEVRDVQAIVAQPGQLEVSLLGMSYIRRLSKFELSGDQLVLFE